ncbi:hypothetical protein IFM89_029485, partial [Coptis chinensis]
GKIYYLRLSAVDEFNNKKLPMQLLISFSAENVRNQAATSIERTNDGLPLLVKREKEA